MRPEGSLLHAALGDGASCSRVSLMASPPNGKGITAPSTEGSNWFRAWFYVLEAEAAWCRLGGGAGMSCWGPLVSEGSFWGGGSCWKLCGVKVRTRLGKGKALRNTCGGLRGNCSVATWDADTRLPQKCPVKSLPSLQALMLDVTSSIRLLRKAFLLLVLCFPRRKPPVILPGSPHPSVLMRPWLSLAINTRIIQVLKFLAWISHWLKYLQDLSKDLSTSIYSDNCNIQIRGAHDFGNTE